MSLSNISLERLATCDKRLQMLVVAVNAEMPVAVLVGRRGAQEQNQAFHDGRSKLKWPHSKHNWTPSRAVDLASLPVNWSDLDAFKRLADVVKRKAAELGIKIVWGGDWETFKDYDHFELVD